MNNQIIEYIKKRIDANKKMLLSIRNPSSIIMIENAITELEGVLEILEVYPSMTSQEVKFAEG